MSYSPPNQVPGPDQQPVTVVGVQMTTSLGDNEQNRSRSLDWLARAGDAGARLAVLPELCVSGYAPSSREQAFDLSEPVPGPSVDAWADAARRADMIVVGGLCERDGERCYNTAVAVGPGGLLGRYRKAHLFEKELEAFDRGDTGFGVIQLDFCRLGILICYDLRFPEAVRTLAVAGADIIAVPTAWVTLSGRVRDEHGVCIQAYCAMAHASMNRTFLVCADTVGPFRDTGFLGNSLITDVTGWPLVGPAGSEEELLLTCSLVPSAARSKHITPYNDVLGDRRPDLYHEDGAIRR